MYGDVIVDITHGKLDKVFEYKIPSHLEGECEVGMEVMVPFGLGNRQIKGYVVKIKQTPEYDVDKIKEILEISPDREAIEGRMVALAAWLKEHYGGTMIQALKTVVPIKQRENHKIERDICLLLNEEEAKARLETLHSKKTQTARVRLLTALLQEPILSYTFATGELKASKNVIQYFENEKIIEVVSRQVWRNPVNVKRARRKEIILTDEQQKALNNFKDNYNKGIHQTYLLHGITGSGKTEIYIEMIKLAIAKGKQAIVMIPEIALTYQTVMRFYNSFGERISIMNSRLSKGERYDQMMRAKNGRVDVMIGPRSALFTPFPNLGLIIIDEEHESTYKSEQVPRYHVRETAIKRADMEKASVVLGSATPSLEAMYQVRCGKYKLLPLKNRISHQTLAKVETVDMREELRTGNRSIFSRKLRQLMEEKLKNKEQIMLFINRRGFAGFISCRTCGYVVRCKNCDVSLAVHKNKILRCHYCGYEEIRRATCPECDSKHVGEFKVGTQQIEDLVKSEFVGAKVLRMDMDTTKTKDSHEKILSAFAEGRANVLIGTQMIVKGHDFPGVTLVGVLAADMSLHSGDYHGGERTFQLITQAVGRAGRGDKKGEAVIQTYSPKHYSIIAAAKQDYEEFYLREISYRQLMGYPPVENLLAIFMTGEDEGHLEIASNYLKGFAVMSSEGLKVKIIGPTSPAIERINNVYRKVFYIKAQDYETLVTLKNKMEAYIEINSGFQRVFTQFDFNPVKL